MKKLVLVTMFLLYAFVVTFAQIVTSTPAFVTESGSVTVVFDASLGNKGLSGFSGEIYAHTGVITNLSTSNTDWKYVKAGWSENIADCKLTPLGNNKWQLYISPDIRTYYGITNASEQVQKLAFVFRNSDGSKTGKDVGDADIFLNVYQPGLNVSLNTPSTEVSLVSLSSAVSIAATASQPATMKLFIDQAQIGNTQTNVSSIITNYTFNSEGNHYIIAEASNGSETVRDSAWVCVRPATVPTATRPASIHDGINYISGTEVTLSLFAKGKSFIYLLGDFNDWKPDNRYQMNKDGDYFWIKLTGLTPGKEYGFQYYADGSILCADPYSEKILDPWNDKYINEKYDVYPNLMSYPTGKTESVISVLQTSKPEYSWNTTSFIPPAPGNLIIYELHFRDFTTEGTVNAAYGKLDYLQHIGINAIELMPIQEFDGNDSWGYNPNFWFAPDKAYGTSDDYKRFIDECHRRGIAVILDVVFNQSWGLSPMVRLWWDDANSRPSSSNPYMFPIAMHPYNVGYDFNHSSEYTRNYFKAVLKHWLTEYRVDGFRFDLSKGFTPETFYTTDVSKWGNYNQGRIDILSDYYQTVKSNNANAYAIMEHFADNDEETVLANAGMMLWGNMNNAFCQSAMGIQSSSGFTNLTAASRGWTKPQLVGYMESHDEERTSYKALTYGVTEIKSDSVLRMKQLAANAAFFLTAPGPKMIWQFGELGYDTSIEYNGRTGRKPVRWDYLESPERKGLYENYSKVLNFRNQYTDMFANPASWSWQVTEGNWNNGRRQIISNGTVTAIALANFKATGPINAYPVFTKTGTWYELFSGETLNVTDTNMSMLLEAGEFKIYTDVLVNGLNSHAKASDKILFYPNPVQDVIYFKGNNVASIELRSLSGVVIKKALVENNALAISDIPSGIYFGKILDKEGNQYFVKICKK